MDFKQLEAFVKVMEESSFSKAAEAMYISQPSVSMYINALEKELQTQLIFRSTKEVLPTKAGKIFYEYAKNILNLREKSIFTMNSLSDCTSGQVDIMASSVPSQYILPELLAKFHKRYSNVSFQIVQSDSAGVVQGVAAQKCDFGFVGAKIENTKCYYEQFITDKLIIITPYTENSLILSKAEAREFFKNEYFVTREQGSGTKIRYDQFIKELGLKTENLKVSACFSNTQSVINAVSCGLGMAIVSELAADYYIKQKQITPVLIDGDLPQRSFYFVFKKDFTISPIAEMFVNFVRKFARA